MSKGRLVGLLGALLILAACYLAVNLRQSPSSARAKAWLDSESFYRFVDGELLALPDGGSLVLHNQRIESLAIEPGGDGTEPKAAEVSFVVRTDQARYGVRGVMSLHNMDGDTYPIVNLGRGWDVSKK